MVSRMSPPGHVVAGELPHFLFGDFLAGRHNVFGQLGIDEARVWVTRRFVNYGKGPHKSARRHQLKDSPLTIGQGVEEEPLFFRGRCGFHRGRPFAVGIGSHIAGFRP